MTDAPALPTVWIALRPDGTMVAERPALTRYGAEDTCGYVWGYSNRECNGMFLTRRRREALAAGYRVVECRLVPMEDGDAQ